jgi:hypothetical protein
MVPVPPPAAPERLTAMLRGAGVLERGRVLDVAVESSRETLISRITRLRLTYDDAGAGPSHVFWKSQRETSDPRQQDFGRREVDFYRLVAAPCSRLTRSSTGPGGTTRASACPSARSPDQSGAFDTRLAAMPADLAALADRLGDRLSTERKQRYERLIAAAPRLLDRYRAHP